MIHLACIVDGGADATASEQLPPEVVVEFGQGLACVGQRCGELVPPTDAASLVEHDRLVQQWMHARGSVVPFRYGTVVEDAARIRAELAPRHAEFRHVLARLTGRVELALRVAAASEGSAAWPSEVSQCQRTGRSYLRSLEPGRTRSPWQQLHHTLADFAVAAVVDPDGRGGIKASYLVDGTDVDGFCRLLASTVAHTGGLGPVSLTGPWPPYSFTAADDDRPLVSIIGGSPRGQHA